MLMFMFEQTFSVPPSRTSCAVNLRGPDNEKIDEDRNTLIAAMQGQSQWYDYHTVAHWIEEIADLVERENPKKDDAHYCEMVDGECDLCERKGKCRFIRAIELQKEEVESNGE